MLNSAKDGNCNALERLGQIFSNSQLQLLCELTTNTDNAILRRRQEVDPEQVATPPAGGGLRVACWNLERFTKAKAANPGVREVFCRTLLEHRIDLLAVQELAEPEALHLLVAELNSPTLPAVVRWPAESRGKWHCSVSGSPTGRQFSASEFGAFLWNSCLHEGWQLELSSGAPLKARDIFTRLPCLTHFKVINKHLKLSVNI